MNNSVTEEKQAAAYVELRCHLGKSPLVEKLSEINTWRWHLFFPNPGTPVEDRVNIFINSFGSIQETTMVRTLISLQPDSIGNQYNHEQ